MTSVNTWQSVVFGAVQGLTEFLPVSSSGHLAVLQKLFHETDLDQNLVITLWVHTATLAAVVVYFRLRIWEVITGCWSVIQQPSQWTKHAQMRFALLVLLSTAITGFPALPLESPLEHFAANMLAVGCAFCFTALVLVGSLMAPKTPTICRSTAIPWSHAVLIGLAQLLAVTPGISRSGMTIVAALLLGWARPLAVEYSFFLAIPAIAVPMALKAPELGQAGTADPLSLTVIVLSFVSAAATGFLALILLSMIVNQGRLYRFALYVLPLGLACVAWSLLSSR